MRKNRLAIAVVAAGASALVARVPSGWFFGGSQAQQYECSIDPEVRYQDMPATYLKSRPDIETTGFGTMMQMFDAAAFADRRVRFSGYLRTAGIKHGAWASLWMRVDGENGSNGRPRVLEFDNMHDTGKSDRSLKGTNDWQNCSIVLDVPVGAKSISIGLMLTGSGAVWLSGVKFESVGPEVQVTGGPRFPGM